jgi:hypothetical protein
MAIHPQTQILPYKPKQQSQIQQNATKVFASFPGPTALLHCTGAGILLTDGHSVVGNGTGVNIFYIKMI